MTDLAKLKEVLLNQQERGIASGDWKRLEFQVEEGEDYFGLNRQCLRVEALQVAFVFTASGRFVGAYNWKE